MVNCKILVPLSALTIILAGCESDSSKSGNYWETESKSSKTAASTPTPAAATSAPAASSSSSSSSSASSSRSSSSSQAAEKTSATTTSETKSETSSPSATEQSASSSGGGSGDAMSYGALQWTFGGKNASGAAKTSASIGGLRMTSNTLSYSWTGPTLSSWGLSDKDAGALACFFVQKENGSWVGGKFDWISTSRTSRNMENVLHGYGGWSFSGVPNPCNCAFVIVSADCKKRTNVITGRWSR